MQKICIILVSLTLATQPLYCDHNPYPQEQSTYYYYQPCPQQPQPPQWITFIKRCVPPLVLSTLVGAVTGGVNAYFDKKIQRRTPIPFLIWIFISWSSEISIREAIIDSLQHDMNSCSIHHQKTLMEYCAWIASWVAYLHV